MPEVIFISDGEDDIVALPGPSKPRVAARVPPARPIFIGDTDESDEDEPPAVSLTELATASFADYKGKRKVSPSDFATTTIVKPVRSALLDLLDDDTLRFDTPASEDDLDFSSAAAAGKKDKPAAAKKKKVDPEAAKDKAAEAARKREEKELAKQQEKEEKARKKEQDKLDREIAKNAAKKELEVNKLRTSKNDAVREVHVYHTADLALPSSPIAVALPEIRARLEGNDSKLLVLRDDESFLPSVIKFKRHVKASYNSIAKKWVALAQDRWEWESTVVLVVQAEDIIDTITSSPGGLAQWASDARVTMGLSATDQIMVMIKGLNKYNNKTKALADREFAAAARSALGERDPIRLSHASRLDKDAVERELVKLQVAERCFLVHVEKTEDIEDWIYNIAADVAIRPYKLLEKTHLNFCPTEGAKKGSTPLETFEFMLQEVQGITPSAAAGIVAEYHSFRDLMEAYERAERRGTAAEMLQDCEVRNLKNGTANGRRLNKALSRRVYKVFRGQDSLELI